MSKVKIITDSTVYMPESLLKELSIDVIPLHVIWGDELFRDGIDMTPEEFYRRLPQSKIMPTTSQPSPKEFTELYEKFLSKGNDILSIHISSKLSGTVDSAQQAKQILGVDNIEVLDSLFTTFGTGFQVIAAARAAAQGASLSECKAVAKKMRAATNIYFIVSTLEFLKRGGRIGGAAAFMGTALDLKPILMVKEGKIEAFEKIRTMKKAVVRIVDILDQHIGAKRPIYLGISQATAPENAQALKDEIFKRYGKEDFIEFVEGGLSPVIGVHAGPGALALSFASLD